MCTFNQLSPRYCLYLLAVLLDAWIACYDADVLLESPSAMAGIHIAEALGEFFLLTGFYHGY